MRSLMAMLRPKGDDAAGLYGALIAEARRPGWYLERGVPDTLDGRFAVLSTLTALAILRLEDGNEETARHSVALTESFIADMDAQMREAGFGDPSLGKQVRHLVGALASRVDRWRGAKADTSLWNETTARSLFGEQSPTEAAATFAGDSLRRFDEGLSGTSDRDLMGGRIR